MTLFSFAFYRQEQQPPQHALPFPVKVVDRLVSSLSVINGLIFRIKHTIIHC